MTEPTRLRDTASPDVRALLRSAAPSRSMTSDERSRSRARLGRYVAVAAVAGGLSWIPGAAFGAGLGLIVGIGTLLVPPLLPVDPPLSTPVSASAGARSNMPVVAPSADPQTAPPAPEIAGTARPTLPIAPSATATSTASEDALADEVALLDRARSSLSSSPSEALRLTTEHASRFPKGKLGLEREMVAIDALRRLGRSSEARARAESLLSRSKGSLYEDRIRKMLASHE